VQSIQIKTVRGQGVNGAEEDEILAVRRFRRRSELLERSICNLKGSRISSQPERCLRVGCDGVVLSENRLAQGFHQCCELCRSFGILIGMTNGSRAVNVSPDLSIHEKKTGFGTTMRSGLPFSKMRPQTGGIRIVAVWVSFAAFDACHPIPAKQPRAADATMATPIHRFAGNANCFLIFQRVL